MQLVQCDISACSADATITALNQVSLHPAEASHYLALQSQLRLSPRLHHCSEPLQQHLSLLRRRHFLATLKHKQENLNHNREQVCLEARRRKQRKEVACSEVQQTLHRAPVGVSLDPSSHQVIFSATLNNHSLQLAAGFSVLPLVRHRINSRVVIYLVLRAPKAGRHCCELKLSVQAHGHYS